MKKVELCTQPPPNTRNRVLGQLVGCSSPSEVEGHYVIVSGLLLTVYSLYWVNLSKRGGNNVVFQGLAGLH